MSTGDDQQIEHVVTKCRRTKATAPREEPVQNEADSNEIQLEEP